MSIVGLHFVFQPVGGDTFVDTACLGLILDHYSTNVDTVGMNLSHKETPLVHAQYTVQ